MNILGKVMALMVSFAAVGALAQVKDTDANTKAQAKYIPQRADDIAWKNDRIAFRIYGPKLAIKEPTGSGIDVWVKLTREMVIDKWYKVSHYLEWNGGFGKGII